MVRDRHLIKVCEGVQSAVLRGLVHPTKGSQPHFFPLLLDKTGSTIKVGSEIETPTSADLRPARLAHPSCCRVRQATPLFESRDVTVADRCDNRRAPPEAADRLRGNAERNAYGGNRNRIVGQMTHPTATMGSMDDVSTIAPGSVVVIRDEEWLVRSTEMTADGLLVTAQGLGELGRVSELMR